MCEGFRTPGFGHAPNQSPLKTPPGPCLRGTGTAFLYPAEKQIRRFTFQTLQAGGWGGERDVCLLNPRDSSGTAGGREYSHNKQGVAGSARECLAGRSPPNGTCRTSTRKIR